MAPATDEGVNLDITMVNICLCIFAFALMIFVVGGNVLTLLAIVLTPVLRTLANIYVFSLAVADLIIGLLFILTGMFMLPPIKYEYFDRNMALCIFLQGTTIGLILVSSFHMTLISFDRYIYITKPYLYPRLFTKRNILICIACIWVLGLVATLAPHLDYNRDVEECDLSLTLPRWYLFYMTTFTYCCDVVIAIVFYSRILLAAFRQRRSIQATTLTVGGDNMQQKKGLSSESAKIGWKSIKFFFTIFGFFFVCITPCVVALSIDLYATLDENVVRASTLVLMMNSGMNFVIYVVLNKQFKTAFIDILRCRPSSQ